MSIKEITGPQGLPKIEEPTPADGTNAAAEVEAAGSTEAMDPISEIAADLAAGRISGDTAVDRLIAHTMDAEIVSSAPAELRAELTEALKALIETDPHLRSLAREMSAGD